MNMDMSHRWRDMAIHKDLVKFQFFKVIYGEVLSHIMFKPQYPWTQFSDLQNGNGDSLPHVIPKRNL